MIDQNEEERKKEEKLARQAKIECNNKNNIIKK